MAGNKANTKRLTNTDTGLPLRLDLPICGEPSRTGGETQCVSCSRPKGQSLSPDREDFPGRQAVGLLFQRPVR